MEPSVEAILKKLESLSSQDRHWVIERLPASVKSVLLSGGGAHDKARMDPASNISMDSLSGYPPAILARVLAGEPSWIVEALLCDGESAWRKQVLLHLPAVARASATPQLHAPIRVSKPVLDSLRRNVCRKLDAEVHINPAPDDRPRWQRWLELRALRFRIHL